MSDGIITEGEALRRLLEWKGFWRHGDDAPEFTEPRRVRTPIGLVWHSHDRRERRRERRFWPGCGCEVADGVPPLPLIVIEGPQGQLGFPKPLHTVLNLDHVKCYACGAVAEIHWFHEGDPVAFSCEDEGCFPVFSTREIII